MKKNYLKIAKGLGIILPACLLASTAEAKNAEAAGAVKTEIVAEANLQSESNAVRDRISESFNQEAETSPYQIAHSNVHANYTISHTNVHTDYSVQNKHQNSHSNTPSKHVNDHTNSKL